ncbi:ParM/StbA family protein [Romboutsia sp. 1001216sp1]|uniref:ParM/StbA family protein n=1 Tax=Romboutsia sp. 1001216sp1 TaxID=2986997 RepID=UPI00232DBB0A|nr:ParM/StbA family protein [Romboutsia sp. 1001216sp1]MDB8790390.1 ParM/StbA family protein [Romboutsia sp. 1001216sp1]
MENIQEIGFDCGRGYVKAYSEVDGSVHQTKFKSVIGDGRDIDLSDFNKVHNPNNIMVSDNPSIEKPRYIEFENERYFIGLLAEKESQAPIRNSKDSKISETVRVLLASTLNDIAVKNKVKIMVGVPYKSYRKSVLKEVLDTYKGHIFKVKDRITGATKEIQIVDISILREADAAVLHALGGNINTERPIGLATIGFRSSELSFFDKNFVFNDKKSTTIEFGNRTLLARVQSDLMSEGITKDVNEIDSSNDYNDKKAKVFKLGSENLSQRIEDIWINLSEMDLYIAGGTALNLNFDEQFKIVDDAQMATARGLFEAAQRRF